MSTPLFLLLSLPVGLAAAGLAWLLGKLIDVLFGPVPAGRRLQRRLDHRMARGTDLYFEELRSIEAAIERNERHKAWRPRNWLRWPHNALAGLLILWMGTYLLTLTSVFGRGGAPAWTGYSGLTSIAMIGLFQLTDPASSGLKPRTARLVGAVFLVFGVSAFTLELSTHNP